MFGFFKPKPIQGSDLPKYKLSPVPHGKYELRERVLFRGIGSMCYYMKKVATYDLYSHALEDAQHMGIIDELDTTEIQHATVS